MARRQRRRYLIERKVQLALIVRVMLYWFFCLYGIFFLLAAVPLAMRGLFLGGGHSALETIQRTWFNFWPYFLSSLLLLPLVMWDVLRFSHKFAGPVFRIRQVLQQLAAGQDVPPLHFRSGDYWNDLAEDVNRLAAYIQEQRETGSASDDADPETEPSEQSSELVSTSSR